jgi:acyl-CoA reductase-like NAD-dependent aldehyde dehydrogenase
VFNCTIQAGQGCSLLTRAFVHESIYDEMLPRTKTALDAVNVGDPADPEVTMGPLIRETQRQKVESLIRTGLDEGAQIAYGGGRPAGLDTGFFIEPTVFVNVDNSSTIAQTEFFGPVGIFTPFRTEEQALALANDSAYGLGGGVWSSDTARAYRIARQMRTGMVIINGQGGFNFDAPFGGYGQSGLGRERGTAALSEFLEHKSIVWGVG